MIYAVKRHVIQTCHITKLYLSYYTTVAESNMRLHPSQMMGKINQTYASCNTEMKLIYPLDDWANDEQMLSSYDTEVKLFYPLEDWA